jgi:protein TonB
MTRELRLAIGLSIAVHAACLGLFRGGMFDLGTVAGEEQTDIITVVGTVELPEQQARKARVAPPPRPLPHEPVPIETPPAQPTEIARPKPSTPSVSRPERERGTAPDVQPRLPCCAKPHTLPFAAPVTPAAKAEKKEKLPEDPLAAQLAQERAQAAEDQRTAPDARDKRTQQEQAPSRNQQPGARRTKRGARLNARSRYLTDVLARLQRAKRYPWDARRRTIEGTAEVAFTIGREGLVSGLRLARSSGSRVLDRAARETVRQAAPFAPIPRELEQQRLSLCVPIVFRLEAAW